MGTMRGGPSCSTHKGGMVVDLTEGSVAEPSIAGIIELVAAEPTAQDVLKRVLPLAIQLIEGADGASITIFRADLRPRTAVASDDWVREVDAHQYRAEEGPCLEVAATSAFTAGSAKLIDSKSWPVFGPAAAALGVHAALAVGLSADPGTSTLDVPSGALNLYSRSPLAFTAKERDEALLLATIAGVGVRLAGARANVARLREALSSRDVIGQAKGMLMQRHGIDEHEAFTLLRRTSNDLNIKLRECAARVTSGGLEEISEPGTRSQRGPRRPR